MSQSATDVVSPEVQEDLRSQGVGQGTGEYVWGRHGVYAVSFGSTTVLKTKRDRAGCINVSEIYKWQHVII